MADSDSTDSDFFLPSQFLTLDDIVSGFTDDDDDSPQSTLLGCDAVSKEDLLNKAADEVAKMKVFESVNNTYCKGTGFFDCSNSVKLLKYPPAPPPPSSSTERNTINFPPRSPFCSHHYPHFRHFPPHMMLGQVQLPQQHQQKRAIMNKNNNDKKTNKNNCNNNRPLGLPPSAWPPLPGQAQSQAQLASTIVGPPQRDSVGTGVFLPRQVYTTADHNSKSGTNVVLKTKSNRGSQRRNSHSMKGTNEEILLPPEWVY